MLLFVVCRRGITRRLPFFAALLTFYPLRSFLLRLFVSHLAPDTYAITLDTLSLADILLQLLVALEFGREILRASSDERFPHALLILPVATVAGLATILFVHVIPDRMRMHPDRFQIFDSMFMILLCVWSFRRSVPTLIRQAVTGLTVVAGVGLLEMVGRNQAVIHRDPLAFAFWAYSLTSAYILVALYWIACFKQPFYKKPDPARILRERLRS
jgi:hypothetical protein